MRASEVKKLKVCFVIAHPAHVHYFKYLIKKFKQNNIDVLVLAREKEFSHLLLKQLDIDYYSIGRGSEFKFGKLITVFSFVTKIFKIFWREQPDVVISFANVYASIVSWLFRKKSIALDDTEHNHLNHLIYPVFASLIITSNRFHKNLGKKQLRFDFATEVMYLNSDVFQPQDSIYDHLFLSRNEKFILIRFVSWNAIHDNLNSKIDNSSKIDFVSELSKLARVFISSEEILPAELEPYQLRIDPTKVHDVIYHSSVFIGDSGTMSTEAAYLGTTSICLNPDAKKFGVFEYYTDSGVLRLETDLSKVVDIVSGIFDSKFNNELMERKEIFKDKFIDINQKIYELVFTLVNK